MNETYRQDETETQSERDMAVQGQPIGHAINPGPVTTKTCFFRRKSDWAFSHCSLVLTNYLGSGMWLRYRNELLRETI